MRSEFSGYYRPTPQEFDRLWKRAIFVLDTNVLLNLYRYSNDTCQRLIDVLNSYKTRLWIPHQVAKEFHKNRLVVISDQASECERIRGMLEEQKKKIETGLAAYNRYGRFEINKDTLDAAFQSTLNSIVALETSQPNFLENDPVLESVTELYDHRVGMPYDEQKFSEICKLGEQRYARQIPPGFMDAKQKEGEEKYGDLVAWQQILDHSKLTNLPIILVTEDSKDDWWWRLHGKTIGPRPELVKEMRDVSGNDFYMYKTAQFIQTANSYLPTQISEKAIEEVQSLSREANVTKRLLSKLQEEEAFLAVRIRDLLATKNALEEQKTSLNRRLKDFDEVRDPYDGLLQSMDPNDRRWAHERATLLEEYSKVNIERQSVKEELMRLLSEVSNLSSKQKQTSRRVIRSSGERGLE